MATDRSAATKRRRRRKPRRAPEIGIDTDLYESLLASQDGHCALCPNEPKTRRLHVDHNHRTGMVRGLLCYACNRRLSTNVTSQWLKGAYLYVLADERQGDVPDQWADAPDQWADAR